LGLSVNDGSEDDGAVVSGLVLDAPDADAEPSTWGGARARSLDRAGRH